MLRFVARASGEGASLVLVITGKGRIADENRERGVLRRRVPQWLGEAAFRKFVVGFEEAHIGHGGEGALYVRLREKAAWWGRLTVFKYRMRSAPVMQAHPYSHH